jgi:hypothetical protein
MKALFPLLALAFQIHAANPPAFEPLFNGRDLTGWVNVNCAPETFVARDGVLHCDGIPTGALRTEHQYENFVLELEWRHMKSGGNAGVFIWSGPLPAVGQPFLRAIEVQVLDHGYGKSDWFTTHGDIFPIHGSSMKPFSPSKGDRSFPREFRSKGTNEWNHYRIVATNGVIRLSVNGAEVSGGTDCNWRRGYIALESEGGVVEWRNIRIQRLLPNRATPAQSAPAAEPWKALYDGRSLRGWTASDAAARVWKPSDWTLRCEAGAPADALLWSDQAPAESFFIDWQWSAKSSSRVPPVVFRGATRDAAATPSPVIELPAVIQSGLQDGWNRIELRRAAGGFDASINGITARIESKATRLQMGLRPGPDAVVVASPFARLPDRSARWTLPR